MDARTTSDLKIVALELRLAAHDPAFTSGRLTERRMLELADMVEAAILRSAANDLTVEAAALTALSRTRP